MARPLNILVPVRRQVLFPGRRAPQWVPRVNGIPARMCIDFLNNRAWQYPHITTPARLLTNNDTFNSTGWCGDAEHTILAIGSGDNSTDIDAGTIFYADNGSSTTEMMFIRQGSSSIVGFGRSANATQFNMTPVDPLPHTRRRRMAMGVAQNSVAIAVDGGPVSTDTAAEVPKRIARCFLGKDAASSTWNGATELVAYWPNRVDNESLRRLSVSQSTFFYLAEGDSISRSPAMQTSWPFYVHQTAPLSWAYSNLSVSSSSLGSATDAANISGATRTGLLDAALVRFKAANPTAKNATVFWTGYNDKVLDGDSTSTYLSQYSAYLTARGAVGHNRIVVGVTPSTTAGFNTWRNTVNATLATWVGSFCEYYVDWTGVTGGADGDASDTNLYSDGIHPTAAQSQTFATEIYDQALSLAAA